MASPRMWQSPSMRKSSRQSSTPSKRTRFRELFSENDDIDSSKGLQRHIDSIKEEFVVGREKTVNANTLLCALMCTYGLEFVIYCVGALRHIPISFMNRFDYIHNIINVVSSAITKKNIESIGNVLQEYASSLDTTVSSDILWKCTKKYDEGYLVFLVPPVQTCLECGSALYAFNKSQITLFTLQGPVPGMKSTTRCKKGCGGIYNIDRYSIPGKGTHFYPDIQPVISSSNCVYLSRDVHELMCESGNHAFVSHHAFSEIYNSLFRTSKYTSEFKKWMDSRTNTTLDETVQYELTRKKAINGYFNGELINEAHERQEKLSIPVGETREDLMREIDDLRRQELYEHKSCSQICKQQGCETLRVIDSCWKVCMPHCMYAVEMEVHGMPLLNFPNVCTREPKPKSVFCAEHHKLLDENGIPTKKEDFLKYIGCTEKPSGTEQIDDVDKKTVELSRKLRIEQLTATEATETASAPTYQGTADMISQIGAGKWDDRATCNKDTGQKSRLRQRSRGHFICVTGGGHIQYFEPIFKSESPSQVFMIVLRVMVLELSNIPEDKLDEALEKFVLSYDNMCQLDSLRASKEPLPFPAPYDTMWSKITKIIDRLHIKNHKNPKCHENYSPDQISQEHNTMVAEQTFAWFSRFKKIVNSMTQSHHLFYIHRNIKRRNAYTEYCKRAGRSPLLPGINVNIKSRY